MRVFKRRIYLRVIQVVISLAAAFFVVYKLIQFKEWSAFYDHINENRFHFWLLLIIQLFLSFLSLSLEGFKWKKLVKLVHTLNFSDALFQILKGIQGGLVTPGRLGDPPSRVLHLPKEIRSKSLLLSVMGTMIQNLVIGTGALIGLLYLNKSLNVDANRISLLESAVIKYVGYFALLILTGQVLLFVATRYFSKINLINKITSFFLIVKNFELKEVLHIVILTVLKYVVFCFQFWLILLFFEIVTHPSQIALVALYFGAITLLPTFAIADLGLRGSIGIIIFGLISSNSLGIMLGVFLLWCINFALPAMIPLVWKNKIILSYPKTKS